MTITRTVGGLAGPQEMTFELTPKELWQAHREMEGINDRDDVRYFIEDLGDDDLDDWYGCTREEAEAHITEIALLYRDYLEHGDYFYCKLEHAFKNFFKNP